ncbi:hypothetical protein [Stakelama saccharophila]|uniref:DUF2157 domain-containing protein n=1 Tax=Stakelama saccharophila TaxID=3075605 RepID=A0ABZ0B9R3_9SPHN|nr:hypothetical protein [Stakelama sp. W311]WNO53049.1 hypothetical protein RPR59_11355 [Stakelama sp. W311]
MYSETELDGAVAAGVIPREAAQAFRDHVAAQRRAPAVDEEHFRLLSGFNDIFVTIAIALLLVAVAQIGDKLAPWAAGLFVAGLSWPLAEYFTRRRRLALPSILLLLAFVGGVAAVPTGVLVDVDPGFSDRVNMVILAGIGLLAAGAAWVHWRRFMVPITVAAGAVAIAAVAIGLVLAALPSAEQAAYPVVLVAGLGVFLFAMRWDMTDRERLTRRSDVAFWLHLAAAPMIAHPLFHMLGVFEQDIGPATAIVVIALYLLFAFVALTVDRRALLVSSLAYVLYALYALFTKAGAVELSAAFTALIIGSALLTLSAFWHPMRRRAVTLLGDLRHRLPPVQMPAVV